MFVVVASAILIITLVVYWCLRIRRYIIGYFIHYYTVFQKNHAPKNFGSNFVKS